MRSMNPNLEENQTTPEAPAEYPSAEPAAVATPPSSAPVSVPTPAPSRVWYKNVWLWVSVALFLALASLGGYVIMQEKSDDSNKSANISTDMTAESDEVENDITAITDHTPEPVVAVDPYEGWSTFTSRVEGVTFKYPASLEVKETMAYDPSPYQPQYRNGFYELFIRNKNDSDSSRYVISIDDKPWGCAGPPSEVEVKSYDSIIGKSPITLTEICGNDSPDRTIFAMIKIGSENASLYVDQPFYRNNRATADLILSSFTNVSKK